MNVSSLGAFLLGQLLNCLQLHQNLMIVLIELENLDQPEGQPDLIPGLTGQAVPDALYRLWTSYYW